MADRSTWILGVLIGGAALFAGGAVVTFAGRMDFARRVMSSLNAFRDRRGEELPAFGKWILLAQAAYETEWGKTAAARGHNYWNLSAGSSWKGEIIPGPDTEPDGKGGWRNITQAWRAYPSDQAAISDLVDNWLTWSRYSAARAALFDGDLERYLTALRAGGYFTQDLPTYLAGVDARWSQAEALIGADAGNSLA